MLRGSPGRTDPMALEEPGVGELIRTLSSKIDQLASQLSLFGSSLSGYVTQEQRLSDRELEELKRKTLESDIGDIEKRLDDSDTLRRGDRRLVLSALVAPFIVGLMFWWLTKGSGGAS